jgi:hypothetical protein
MCHDVTKHKSPNVSLNPSNIFSENEMTAYRCGYQHYLKKNENLDIIKETGFKMSSLQMLSQGNDTTGIWKCGTLAALSS